MADPLLDFPDKGPGGAAETSFPARQGVGTPQAPTPPQGPLAAPTRAPGLFSSPGGFYGPGLLANVESRLTGKTPQRAYEQRVPQLETVSQLLGAALAPGSGVLRQAGGQALVGGGLEALKGTGPLRAVGKGLESGVGALVGGGLGRGLLQPAYQKAGAAATKGYDEAVKAVQAAHHERAAARVATELQKDVPALSGFPADNKGLVDMIYGKGKVAVSNTFDKAMKAVLAKHSGTPVMVPVEIADTYGVAQLGKAELAPTGKGLAGPKMVPVSGGELANAITGTWKKDPKAYRTAAEALINAGVVDPQVGKAYKTYIGVSKFVDATGALKGETFNTDAWNTGLTKLKQLEELRRRGLGSATEGYGTLARGAPTMPTPPRIKTSPLTGPMLGGALGHAAGFGLGGMVGHPWLGSMLGGPMGAAAGKGLFPAGLVTQAPVSPTVQALIQALTKSGGATGSVLGP